MSKRSEKRLALDQKKAERKAQRESIALHKNGGVVPGQEYVSPLRGQPISPVVDQVFQEHLAIVEREKEEERAKQVVYEVQAAAYHRAQREHAQFDAPPYYYTAEEQVEFAEQLANPPEQLTVEELRWLHARQQPFHLYYDVIYLDLDLPEARALLRSMYVASGMSQVRSELVPYQWVLLNQLPAQRRWKTYDDDMLPSDWVAQHGSSVPSVLPQSRPGEIAGAVKAAVKSIQANPSPTESP